MSRMLFAAVAFVALSAGAAIAQPAAPLTATLAAPSTKAKPVLASIIWRCEGATCVSASTVNVSDATACRAVARSLGEVTAFSSSRGAFDAAALSKCNGSKAVAAAK